MLKTRFDKNRLKLLREMKDQSLGQFAKEMGFNKMTVSNWESGVTAPRTSDIDVIVDRYIIEPGQIHHSFFWPEPEESLKETA